eukprot:CAMPEP_0195511392 /NCGR_PEP_ID=MMETSP0794_2-20130614/3725_1 /TAXON_ID=515487 /ORGANISM="Stephanopyxis turris, Strain CCMP 815" /LENGTH=476 /DNA_ID=CAMNT_0040638977 /DNA_START=67 /DNA_END=1497 /DNA_ORIENTATION=-
MSPNPETPNITEPLLGSATDCSDVSRRANKIPNDLTLENTSLNPLEFSETTERQNSPPPLKHNAAKLIVTFILFVLSGSFNAILGKLMTIPMYNYPNFLNNAINVLYAAACFLYIIPAAKLGVLAPEQFRLPKKTFAIMGLFDAITYTLQIFAIVYLSGPLVILLQQASIPMSMVMSKILLRSTYSRWQYLGAFVVIIGIIVALEPVMSNRHAPDYLCVAIHEESDCVVCKAEVTEQGCLSHTRGLFYSDVNMELFDMTDATSSPMCRWEQSTHATSGASTTLVWSAVNVVACIPMAISSILKERALEENEIDVIYLNGWVGIFQTLFSFVLSIPAGLTSSPPVSPLNLPANMWDGFKCYVGIGTITTGCHPDQCSQAPLLVNSFVLVTFFFSQFFILLIKFGSANLMFLASTFIVPISNLAFALPIMPDPAVLHASDVTGLLVILSGIVFYRFGSKLCGKTVTPEREEDTISLEP